MSATTDVMTLGERLRAPGSRNWYIGSGAGLLWQTLLVVSIVALPLPVGQKVGGLALLAVIYAAFLLVGPIIWRESARTKILVTLGFWAVSAILIPLVGPVAIWVWLLIVSLAAFTNLPVAASVPISAGVVGLQLAIGAANDFTLGLGFAPIVTAVCAATFIGLGLLGRSNQRLEVANTEIARLAVEAERARFGRDLHDVLGHTLTVVTVKSELARRLVTIDPARAESEIVDIEQLARGALADLRLAVTSYREVTLESELATARTALAAADIRLDLEDRGAPDDAALRSVFAWVLREGVTNVIRHSGSSTCWVTVSPDALTVADDGRGGTVEPGTLERGNGLRGLRERSREVGAELAISPSARDGFALTVRAAQKFRTAR
ncbi:sensor histidine kinase [Lacisediminihabitans changchengi]|uniref:Two-component sensor histidine kinase n=1 Tax=Lacisediminihabitans changchengi TaxID=2787634 RepID=A0A934SGE3_9MICO|nr:histidine kinase [Lacisediminihabitans changchengi]MBK4346192.1 two-component sensor histidine kinase [Lacisediminihabitans changchengi]